jgi:hypothetical protein
MRFIFGIVIGCLLTVGQAYVIDTVSARWGKANGELGRGRH